MMGSSSDGPIVFSSDGMKSFTDNFNEKNLMGFTQFGKLYRGKIKPGIICTQSLDITVKIWDEKADCITSVDYDQYWMVKEEVQFLTNPSVNRHPNLVKLIGYCCEKEVRGVVYELNPKDTLHNLTLADDLSWIQRVNIILQLAGLLEFLHNQDKPYLVLDINASHIILDWDCRPKLCDFGFISGRIIGEMNTPKKQIPISIGYMDPSFAAKDGYRQTSSRVVFGLGVILLGLISKRPFEGVEKLETPKLILENLVQYWAKMEYRPNCSLVHRSLQEDWGYHVQDGAAITELGMRCIEFLAPNRPSMNQIVQSLQNLMVLQRLGDKRPNKREKKFHETLLV
ncbi:hypothetical protein FEM48_Zijuj10G0030800 [Ziziphus jujuba var. spinosa]|uniref:Protein kinase domain-containing protein n=1 Tax=Ziziphus jujuba var. spinosa TaxID=714518 RepID=A0A978UKX7_ZIZJJ|nr:hypothetical protein FEM48_Zijuj10G0030800 [Ziziphus jujuba var. spinosa]